MGSPKQRVSEARGNRIFTMGKISLLFVALLPFSLALVAKVPFGNNKHYGGYDSVHHSALPYKQAAPYHGGCHDLTEGWQAWEGGSSGSIRIKRKPTTHSAAKDWALGLVFDKPLQGLDVFNGVILKEHQAKSFEIKPETWNARLSPGEETVVNIKATYTPGSLPAHLEGVVIDGTYHSCNATQAASPFTSPVEKIENKAVVITKGFRQATHPQWPSKVLGLYILLADDDEDGFESDADWDPELYEWQQEASNVLFFTFVHPGTMEIPPTFQKLAATRGTDAPGAVPANTVILFAIGGYAYSLNPNPWVWLTSQEAAEEMAEKVADWPALYGCDGIDLDLEEGAGARQEAGPNMVHFIRRLRELQPNIIISQPTYGYPQVQAEIDVINDSWDAEGNSNNLADSIGLMVYEGTQALQYVKNYANGAGQWPGFPVKVRAPSNTILLGAKGASRSSDIVKLANAAVSQDLLGIMVWYASVKNGFDYSPVWDASTNEDSKAGYKSAMAKFKDAMGGTTKTEEDNGSIVDTVDTQHEAVIEVLDDTQTKTEEDNGSNVDTVDTQHEAAIEVIDETQERGFLEF